MQKHDKITVTIKLKKKKKLSKHEKRLPDSEEILGRRIGKSFFTFKKIDRRT